MPNVPKKKEKKKKRNEQAKAELNKNKAILKIATVILQLLRYSLHAD